ncbi:MAG TPA: molybdopterin-synthase adenylyltransferase MoeB [Chthoniobacterales bacterium]|nr:molybdopterin-synthase adenylyltransferase MoeB [Chthoniobacterales bacterium]
MSEGATAREDVARLSQDELLRYSRQINLAQVGEEGQCRLKQARVLCIGAGGLGSPAALYLVAAGIGTIGIIDQDTVDLSNLHRQILHGAGDVGSEKTDSARARLLAINPTLAIETYTTRLSASNASELIHDYDVVVDGSDNLPTRYLSSDVCVWEKKPNVYGSVHQFEGQASLFAPHLGGPCYRCLFPEPPPPEAIPSCAEAGVLGVVPGLIGMIQALEAIKLIINKGDNLLGRLLHVDALTLRFREFKIRRDPNCPVCGDSPIITEPIDYEQFCSHANASKVSGISAKQLQEMISAGKKVALVDVREPFEFEIARIPDSQLIPLGTIPERLADIPRTETTVVMCKSGVRSARVIEFLREQGFENLLNLEGGLDAWREDVDPTMRKY